MSEQRASFPTLEDVVDSWSEDSVIDKSELAAEALKIEQVYDKYLKMQARAKRALREIEARYKRARLERFEFYTMGPTKAQLEAGERLPAQGRLLKRDAEPYVDCDPRVLQVAEELAQAADVVDALSEKLRLIRDRNFRITNAIADMRHKDGAR